MELVVLGASAAYPNYGRACSGYLVRKDKTNILVDCGTGVLSNLFRWMDPAQLDMIVITHLHTDHFLDIYPLRYYLQYDSKIDHPLLVLAPAGAQDHILQLITGERRNQFTRFFRFEPIDEKAGVDVDCFRLEFFAVPHFKETFAVTITNGQKKIAFSSDCGIGCKSVLTRAARSADLLVCEATLQEDDGGLEKGHLRAEQAGEIAAAAKAKRLMLTHIWGSLNPEISKNQAAKSFGQELLIAAENQKISI